MTPAPAPTLGTQPDFQDASERKSTGAAMKKSILNCFFRKGHLMIPDIAKLTGYSVPTITKYIHDSMAAGLVIAAKTVPETKLRGRKATWYMLNPESVCFLGVDTKHYALVLSVMNLAGEIILEHEDKSLRFANTPQFLETMCYQIRKFIRESSMEGRIAAACFNISGRVNSRKGLSHSIFAFENNEDEPLADILSRSIGIPSVIENDTRAMLYGELYKGNIGNHTDCLYVNVSWGLGLGILTNGRIYRGADDFAGEFGHTKAFDNEIICHCGKKGCLETEVSGQAAKRILTEQLAAGKASILDARESNSDGPTVQDIIRAANGEDPLCQDILEEMGRKLGLQLANLINIFNPQAIIIGGSMSKDNDFLLESIRMSIKKYSLKLIHRNLVISNSKDPDRIGVAGACLIARDKFVQDLVARS